ncbi:hypothetical protein B0H14DRAFT_3585433 [Mycena olivaceomarginata]|nr:hypothetical protein B0H14DRAFT_3585433 [Mycena olivaceomarginata]
MRGNLRAGSATRPRLRAGWTKPRKGRSRRRGRGRGRQQGRNRAASERRRRHRCSWMGVILRAFPSLPPPSSPFSPLATFLFLFVLPFFEKTDVTPRAQHGVGNWKAILSDPTLEFQGRSPVDLKDRFRTYFPEAYRTHYPNARTQLPPSLAAAAASSSSPPLGTPSSASPSAQGHPPSASASAAASTSSTSIFASPSSAAFPAPASSKPNRSTHPDGTPLFPLPSPAHPKRRPFSAAEDSALLAGFRKHGAAWAAIAKDAPVFGLTGRRSMDLRDRFRNAWPGEYEAAGYKARPRGRKKEKEKERQEKEKERDRAEDREGAGKGKGKDKMKEEEGEVDGEDEPRGRARVGRAQTDQGPGTGARIEQAQVEPGAGANPAGGPVRRRRRAHTSQGFKSVSMPGSDDEGGGGAGGGAASDFGFSGGAQGADFGMNFGRGVGGEFGFRFVPGPATAKGEETALVGGMRHLEMDVQDEAMPDAQDGNTNARNTTAQTPATATAPAPPMAPPPPPAPSTFQSQFLQHRRAEELALGMHSGGGGTIGRSAWGTQDWLSANPRLDPGAALDNANLDQFSVPLRTASLGFSPYAHSPPLSSSASFSTPGGDGGPFERAHGVMERYDLEPASSAHLHHHHHHHVVGGGGGGGGAYGFGSPALSFHSASLSLDTHPGYYSHDEHYSAHSLSEAGTRDDDGDPFDEDSSAFSINADSEPGGAASWAGANGGGGGFRGFTHHSNTAGDLIFGARTHQPIWSGVDAWGARGLGFGVGMGGRGMGLAGIAEVHGGKRGEEGEAEAEGEAAAGGEDGEDKSLGLFSLDDLVDLSQHEPPEADVEMDADDTGAGGGGTMEPPADAAPACVACACADPRSLSVPPGEAPEDGLGIGNIGLPLGLMSAPATPALGAAATLSPPSSFALDPTLLGLGAPRNMHATNTLHATLMGPTATAGHGHGEAMYDLPFLDLHYYNGGAGAQQMQVEGWRGGEALDLARTVGGQQSFAPSAFVLPQPQSRPSQVSQVPMAPPVQAQTGGAPPPGVWKALGVPTSLRQHVPARPLMRRASAGVPGVGMMIPGAASSGSGHARSVSHQRGQSAVVRPQDLVLSPEGSATGAGPKGKRKRASWDGGGW